MPHPQIIGVKPLPVAERPKCLTCVKPLRPEYRWIEGNVSHSSGGGRVVIARYFTGNYGLHCSFCGVKHAQIFALNLRGVRHRRGEFPRLQPPPITPAILRKAARIYEAAWHREGAIVTPLEPRKVPA